MKKKLLKELVKNAIVVYMNKGFAFTAIDICNHVRAETPDKIVRYKEVSTVVKKNTLVLAQENAKQYNATLQRVDAGNDVWAYVYHAKDFDPANYLARDQTTLQTA